VKLIYDGDRSQRNWWVERFGKEPEIECPNCKSKWVGLTDDEVAHIADSEWEEAFVRLIEAKLKEKNT
jgi:hypothetical protein